MGRTRTEPKIGIASFKYNGDNTAFDNFIEAMIHDYLNSSETSQTAQVEFMVCRSTGQGAATARKGV